MSKIPVGFQLHIHSWENDADNPGVEILNGLTKEDVKFYVHLLQLFCRQSDDNYGNGMGLNMSVVGKAVLEIYLEHPNVSKDVKDRFEWLKDMKLKGDEDEISDGLHEVIGDLIGNSEFYDFRVFDHAEVYEIKTPIDDVSSKFKFRGKVKAPKAEGLDDEDEEEELEE